MERTEKAKQAHAPGIAALTVPEHEQGAGRGEGAPSLAS